jgi:biopolymer transport protein ExbB
MKHFSSILLTGFILPFLPLSAENISDELDLELSWLDEELAEFTEELSSLEPVQEKLEAIVEAEAPLVEMEQAPVVAVEEIAPVVESKEESVVAVEEPAVVEEQVIALEIPVEEPTAVEEQIIALEIPVEAAQTPIEIQAINNVISEQVPAEVVQDVIQPVIVEEPVVQEVPVTLIQMETAPKPAGITVDLQQAFAGSPIIYSLLLAMSVISVGIWLYAVIAVRASARVPKTFLTSLQNKLSSNSFDEVLVLCEEKRSLLSRMLISGIYSRRHGLPVMIEAMKAEGKRSTISFWQKIGLLNDIAIIAPMLGLLGTVLGMFYAFYDINRSMESISTLFDGLGISVGTTVAGLVVAILALILHSTAKYRLVKALAHVENEAQNMAVLIDDRTSIHRG